MITSEQMARLIVKCLSAELHEARKMLEHAEITDRAWSKVRRETTGADMELWGEIAYLKAEIKDFESQIQAIAVEFPDALEL